MALEEGELSTPQICSVKLIIRMGANPTLILSRLGLLIFLYSTFVGALFLLCKQTKQKGKLSKLHSESTVWE
jgi:hypothetical protein